MGEKKTSDRSSTWTSVIYPESLPTDWQEVITQMQMPIAVSPLHDKDFNPDGTPKKPHYHIALNFDSLKSYKQVLEVVSPLNGTVPQRCKSIKGTVRYMTHMDNPEKAQYRREDIISFGGFDVDSMFTPTATDRILLIDEMIEFIIQNNVTEFIDMLTYAKRQKRETWFPLLAESCGYIIGQAVKSQRHRGANRTIIIDTGEIIE